MRTINIFGHYFTFGGAHPFMITEYKKGFRSHKHALKYLGKPITWPNGMRHNLVQVKIVSLPLSGEIKTYLDCSHDELYCELHECKP